VGEALDALRPDVIAFSKTDVWPNLTREAARRGVRLLMISGTLPASSSRLRGPARRLLLPAYRRLDHIAAISREDAERFGSLGVPPGRRSVMGDAHFDRVLARVAAIDRQSGLLRRLEVPQPVLVAGSTWPADEQRLLGVLAALREAGAPLRTILVPHEPSEEHLRQTEARLAALGLASVRLGSLQGAWTGEEILLVDRVGVLGELYALAAIAYVGGGYGSAGLHSVLEPAAFGIPVLFGPRHTNAREAGELVRAGGAFVGGGSNGSARTGAWSAGSSAGARRRRPRQPRLRRARQGSGGPSSPRWSDGSPAEASGLPLHVVAVAFRLRRLLQAGDVLSLRLLGFTGRSGSGDSCSSTLFGLFSASLLILDSRSGEGAFPATSARDRLVTTRRRRLDHGGLRRLPRPRRQSHDLPQLRLVHHLALEQPLRERLQDLAVGAQDPRTRS
jgi:hypothetical protein